MFSEGDLNAGWSTGISGGGGSSFPWGSVAQGVGQVASAYMNKKNQDKDGAGAGYMLPPNDQSLEFFGGVKDINFSGSLNSQLPYLLIGAVAVVILGWLKQSKRKK